jgi:hypothetical protein
LIEGNHRPAKMGLHRIRGQPKSCGDLIDRQLVEVPQGDAIALAPGQRSDRIEHSLMFLDPNEVIGSRASRTSDRPSRSNSCSTSCSASTVIVSPPSRAELIAINSGTGLIPVSLPSGRRAGEQTNGATCDRTYASM